MSTAAIYEIIGYVGSGLVLVSFLMSSVVKLRLVSSAMWAPAWCWCPS